MSDTPVAPPSSSPPAEHAAEPTGQAGEGASEAAPTATPAAETATAAPGPSPSEGEGPTGSPDIPPAPSPAHEHAASGSETSHESHKGAKKRRDDRKAPIVFRKPTAGPAHAGDAPAEGPTSAQGSDAAPGAQRPKRERKGSAKVFRRADTAASAEGGEASKPEEPAKKKLEIGQKVGGRITELGEEMARLDLGNGFAGVIDVKELRDPETKLEVVLGAEVEGVVISVGPEPTHGVVTRALNPGSRRDELFEAKRWNADVTGLVTGLNKGGLEVAIYAMRGFCPSSQADLHPNRDLTPFVGKRLKFRVLEVREREVVLSHRATMEEESKKLAEEVRAKLAVGARFEGTVTSLKDFGAFVDLGGGVEGMIHLTELSHSHVRHPREVVKAGQPVTVEVVRVDPAKEGEKHDRIALSLKKLTVDPWTQAAPELVEGKRLKAKIARLQPFGAFVELFPGVDGLIHVSALGQRRRIEHPKEVVQVGQEVEVAIESVDAEQRRVKLRLVTPEGEAPGPATEGKGPRRERPVREGAVIDVTVDRVEPSGVSVKWEGGRGTVPNNETGVPKGTDLRKHFPAGMQLKVKVLEVDRDGRFRLSKSAADRDEERRSVRDYLRGEQKKMKGFGTLGDLMKFKKDEK